MALTDEEKRKIEEEEKFRAEARARAESKNVKSQGIGCGQGCLGLFLITIGGCAVMMMMTPTPAPKTAEQEVADKTKARTKACTEPFSAVRTAQEAVQRSLKAPTSAKFPGTFLEPHKDTSAIPGENCSWTISSYVDAQNSFGAMIRNRWQVKLKLINMDSYNNPQWSITHIEVK